MHKRIKKKYILTTIVIMSILLSIAVFCIVLTGCQKANITIPKKENVTYVEYPDVDKFFENNSEVKSIVDISKSKDIMTEKEAVSELEKRGFNNTAITTEYDMAGNYFEAKEISKDSEEMHPSYTAMYQTQNGDIWTLSIIGNQITANPLSYIYQSEDERSLMIIEDDTVISYDSHGNRYFFTIPHEDYLIVKTVKTIDSETLEALTIEEIELL